MEKKHHSTIAGKLYVVVPPGTFPLTILRPLNVRSYEYRYRREIFLTMVPPHTPFSGRLDPLNASDELIIQTTSTITTSRIFDVYVTGFGVCLNIPFKSLSLIFFLFLSFIKYNILTSADFISTILDSPFVVSKKILLTLSHLLYHQYYLQNIWSHMYKQTSLSTFTATRKQSMSHIVLSTH